MSPVQSIFQRPARLRLTLVGLALLVGCQPADETTASAERRARDYLETLVREPGNRERLAGFVNGAADPATVGVESAPVRVALDFLRIRQRQGASLRFRTGDARVLADGAQRVPVTIQFEAIEGRDRIGFDVELRQVDGVWRVRHLSTAG